VCAYSRCLAAQGNLSAPPCMNNHGSESTKTSTVVVPDRQNSISSSQLASQSARIWSLMKAVKFVPMPSRLADVLLGWPCLQRWPQYQANEGAVRSPQAPSTIHGGWSGVGRRMQAPRRDRGTLAGSFRGHGTVPGPRDRAH
jgi:hypothetical protein